MIWEDPNYLWFILLIPAIWTLYWWRSRNLKQRKDAYFNDNLFSGLRKGHWPLGFGLKNFFFLSGIVFLIVSLAGPKIGTEVREIKRRGVDMLIALDLSASMNAEDVRPSRLDKAKFEINRLIERLDGDRVGLIVFTGEAYLQSPMTLDYSALKLFLDIADTDQMPSSATNFKAALETALQAFEALDDNTTEAAKVLLIISDGEDHSESFDNALQQLLENNISIYTVGIGTTEGTTIPIYEENSGRLIGYKRDQNGQVVTTRLQKDVLRSIADRGDGAFYSIERGNDGIDPFLARVDELEQGEFASQEYADFKNQYQWMAAFGLFSIILSVVIPSSKNK